MSQKQEQKKGGGGKGKAAGLPWESVKVPDVGGTVGKLKAAEKAAKKQAEKPPTYSGCGCW